MLNNLLSENIIKAVIGNFKESEIYELRLRNGKNVMINYRGVYTDTNVVCRPEWIDEVLLRAARYSIYAVNEQIKSGYISVPGGIRIGICGETVYGADGIKTIKNITSLNIRLPHEIKGCGEPVIRHCFTDRLCSTLIISKPGAGKTTLLRDICRCLCNVYKHINVLILDERGEISGEAEGVFQFDIGHCDVLLNCKKEFGFSAGVRTMRPDIIICDELKGNVDLDSLYEALSCGVCIVATVHADSLNELNLKNDFKQVLKSRVFQRYVLLSDKPNVGTIKNIFNENMEVVV